MTRQEIERRIKFGSDAKELWHCLFLTVSEIPELLYQYVEERANGRQV